MAETSDCLASLSFSASCTAARFCEVRESTSARSAATVRLSSSSAFPSSISFSAWALSALACPALLLSRSRYLDCMSESSLVFCGMAASCASRSLVSRSATFPEKVRMWSAWLATRVLSSLITLSLCATSPCEERDLRASESFCSSSPLLVRNASNCLSRCFCFASPPEFCSRLVVSSSWASLSSASSLRKRASDSSVFERMPSRNRMNFSLKASWFRCRSSSSSFLRRRSPAWRSTSPCNSSTFPFSLSFSKSGSAVDDMPDDTPDERMGSNGREEYTGRWSWSADSRVLEEERRVWEGGRLSMKEERVSGRRESGRRESWYDTRV
mmetsp:Transcript_73038/g.152516  ORF Transcript_73038/g.152516 Transcript_73038/m.152516 type:complete len:327 (-) Transcript_73038:930-1910(-)